MTLLKHEIKMNLKALLIWALSIGILCAGCILLFKNLEESMSGMADAYSNMGAFSTALGMDKLSVSTMEGFYGTEIALMFAVGGAMFAAMTGAAISRRRQIGAALGFAMLLYVADLMCRIIPDLENLKYATPYYFSNGADIFADKSVEGRMVVICLAVTLLSAIVAEIVYRRRDLAA